MSDFTAYKDEFGFDPLLPPLEERLLSLGDHSEGEVVEVDRLSTEYEELVASGHLSRYQPYISGAGTVIFTAKGARYASDKAGYDSRRRAWEEAARRAEGDARAHDWRLNVVNGVYAIVAALLGYLLAKLAS